MDQRVTKYFVLISVITCVISLTLVLLSTTRLSPTIDEAGHIGAGLEWFQGNYHAAPQNPPFSRVGAAIIPYLAGARIQFPPDFQEKQFSYGGIHGVLQNAVNDLQQYKKLINRGRAGVVIFFVLSMVLVFLIGKHIAGHLAGAIAVLLLATTPVVMAHSGLATTDIPSMATYLFAIYMLILWLEEPSLRRSILSGAALALAVVTKFTSIIFLVPIMITFLILKKYASKGGQKVPLSAYFKSLGISILTAIMVGWMVYRFSWGPVGDIPQDGFIATYDCYATDPLAGYISSLTLPAPEFFKGLADTWCLNQKPWAGYLLEEFRPTGSWLFYPVAFLVKTTIPMLLLFFAAVAGMIAFKRSDWRLLGLFAVIFFIFCLGFISNMNIGIRHIIHVYPFIALVIGIVTVETMKKYGSKILIVVGILILLQIWMAFSSFPHMLSYYNAFAGDEPGEIIVDSDLHWGQGMYELEDYLKEKEVDTLTVAIFNSTNLSLFDLPPLKFMYPDDTVGRGWIAIDEFSYRRMTTWTNIDPDNWLGLDLKEVPFEQRYAWLRKHTPVTRLAGGSLRIYYIE